MANIVSKLNNSSSLTDIMIQVEDWFDSLDLYAFKGWIDGEIIDGPDVGKYWITIILQYDEKNMPDPQGAMVLIKHGARVGFQKAKKERKDNKEKLNALNLMNTSTLWDGNYTQQNQNTSTIKTYNVWLVKIVIPRKFINVNIDNDETLLTPNTTDYFSSNEINESILMEGLHIGDLQGTILSTISIDEYNSKLSENSIVVGFYAIGQEPANDLNKFIQKSSIDILDVEVSPVPTPKGYYIVFVEIERDEYFIKDLLTLTSTIKPLAMIKEWNFTTIGHKRVDLNEKNLKELIDIND